ncbi:MAG: hypothetical protein AAF548_16935, partial [Actinomycetota bacterium]
MRKTRFSMAVLLAIALLFAGCSDDGGDSAELSDDDTSDSDGGGNGGDGGSGSDDDTGSVDDTGSGDDTEPSDDSDGGSTSGSTTSGDLESVWPLPGGDFMVWLPFQVTDNEFSYGEFASFQTMSVTMDEVLDFYRSYFPTVGLEMNELELGESIAINLTNPDDAAWTGVVQTGVDPQGYVTVSQNFTDPKESTTTTTSEPAAASSADGV